MGFATPLVLDHPGRIELESAAVSFQLPGWYSEATFNRTIVADTLNHSLIFVATRTTFDRIATDVNSAAVASSVLRMGLYAARPGDLRPGALLNDFGTVAVDSTGDKLITISLTLERGFYYASYVSDGAPQLVGFDVANANLVPTQGHRRTSLLATGQIVVATTGRTADATGGLANPAPALNASNTPTFAALKFRVTAP